MRLCKLDATPKFLRQQQKQTTGGMTMGIQQQTQQERQTKGEGDQAVQRFVCCGGVGLQKCFAF
jgi:hypothetical protein